MKKVAGLVVLMVLVCTVAFSSCNRLSDCADTLLSEVASPDGQVIAVVFERDCGATTAKNTQICFRRQSDSFNSKRQSSFLVFEGDGKPVLSWATRSNLLVRLPKDSKIFRKESEQDGVKVGYKME